MKKMHQGSELKLILKGNGLGMGEVAETLDMSRQNLNYHLRKETLDKDFTRLITEKLKINFPLGKEEKIKVSFGTEKEEIITALATSKTLVDQVAKLMAVVYKRDVSECMDDLKSSIALMRRGLTGES